VREILQRTNWRREERRQIPSAIQKPREEEEEGGRRHWHTLLSIAVRRECCLGFCLNPKEQNPSDDVLPGPKNQKRPLLCLLSLKIEDEGSEKEETVAESQRTTTTKWASDGVVATISLLPEEKRKIWRADCC
jgi:hypothetical protein